MRARYEDRETVTVRRVEHQWPQAGATNEAPGLVTDSTNSRIAVFAAPSLQLGRKSVRFMVRPRFFPATGPRSLPGR